MKTYTVSWTEISNHTVQLSAEELSTLLGVPVEELEDNDIDDIDTSVLDDALATLDDDGFEGLTREDIEVIEH